KDGIGAVCPACGAPATALPLRQPNREELPDVDAPTHRVSRPLRMDPADQITGLGNETTHAPQTPGNESSRADAPTIGADAASTRVGATTGGRRAVTGPLPIGKDFGRYHIIRMLGIGGMGAVYQAWDGELEVAVAIKVIRPESLKDPRAAAEVEGRFKR